MTNLDYIKSLNSTDLIKFFEDFFVNKCVDCPISSMCTCSDVLYLSCKETLDTWLKMERTECTFKDLNMGDKFKKNGDIYIKTANGYAFNIQTGEGCSYDTENKVYKVAEIEVKEKE